MANDEFDNALADKWILKKLTMKDCEFCLGEGYVRYHPQTRDEWMTKEPRGSEPCEYDDPGAEKCPFCKGRGEVER